MNRRMILYILGRILFVEAILMLPSVLVGILYSEKETSSFFIPLIILALVGGFLGFKKPKTTAIYARDGFFIVAAAWLLMSLAGALPLFISGSYPTYIDAFFEIVSGFSTTGASVLTNLDAVPHCILFWRAFSQWVGGMGVLVFVLAIMPLSEDRSLCLMRAEVPGPIVGKLVPRMRDTAKILYAVYAAMTVLLAMFLLCGGMPLFDSLCHSFSTAGTGGFSVKTEGLSFYHSTYIDMVIAIFMLLFGINFNLYYFLLIKRFRDVFRSEELRWYILIVIGSTLAIATNLYSTMQNVGESLHHAFFQASTTITTTGYSTFDFALAPQFTQHLLLLLMISGGCAGSTAGGLKVSRLILLIKNFFQELRRLLHPRAVTTVRLEGKSIDSATIRSTLTYFAAYILIICISTLLLSLDRFDLVTNLSAEISCFNNIGPGLGAVGPMSSFGGYSPFSKLLLSFNMLLGRLEIMPLLILFTPNVWRKYS